MRKIIFSLVASALASQLQAQLFSSESWNGTVLGGIVGGIIGNNSKGRTGEGVAIGAGAGWLLGTLVHESRRERGWYSSDYVYAGPPIGVTVAGPNFGVSAAYGYAPVPVYSRPSYAWSGAALGGVTGAIIGNNSHGRTAEGAAIGAGAGLLLGGIADATGNQRRAQTPVATARPRQPVPVPRPAPASAPSVQPPNPSGQSQIQHQIPDAPRVPDAPSF
jgi:uncharacterized protein YcfJ